MIVVKVELWPFGDEARAREIERLYIANEGNRTMFPAGARCDYSYGLGRTRAERPGRVQHIREQGAWRLVREVLNDIYE